MPNRESQVQPQDFAAHVVVPDPGVALRNGTVGQYQRQGSGAPRLEEYLQSRQSEALELLSTRLGQDRALYGIDSVWLGARWERPEMLAVEIDYFYPARLSEDGDFLTPAQDVEHPSVIDDCVDEIVERVMDRGGWVALVDPGSIPNDSRIALTVKDS